MARLLSRDEAALLLDVTPQTISNWVEKGVLKGHFVDRLLKIDKATVEKYFDTLSDLAFIEKRIFAAKRDLQLAEKELEKNLDDTRSAIHLLGKGVPAHLLNEIFSSIIEASGDDVLKEREKTILTMLLEGKDVEFVAEEYGLTRSRIMQIVSHAVHKLATVKTFSELRREYKQLVFDNTNFQNVIEALQNRVKKLERINNIDTAPVSEYDYLLGDKGGTFTAMMNTPVYDLDISVRSLNCLKGADVDTLYDLVKCNKTDLMKFRNFGKKSLTELEDLLESLHLHFGMDVDAIIAADSEKMIWEKKSNVINL
jgi:excisionase family DNA binding protein